MILSKQMFLLLRLFGQYWQFVFKVLWATDKSQTGHNCGSPHTVWQGCCRLTPPTKVPLKHVTWVGNNDNTEQFFCPQTLEIYNHEAASPALAYRPVGRGGPHFWWNIFNATHTQNSLPATSVQNQKSINSITFSFQNELNYWWCEGHLRLSGGHCWEREEQPNYSLLTLTLLTWTIWWAPTNASKWQLGFNSAFKGLTICHWNWVPCVLYNGHPLLCMLLAVNFTWYVIFSTSHCMSTEVIFQCQWGLTLSAILKFNVHLLITFFGGVQTSKSTDTLK